MTTATIAPARPLESLTDEQLVDAYRVARWGADGYDADAVAVTLGEIFARDDAAVSNRLFYAAVGTPKRIRGQYRRGTLPRSA